MPRTKPKEIKPESESSIGVGRRRRRRRGQGRAAGGRRVPARPQALPRARRQGPEGHPAARPARHRQDAAGQGGRQRVGREVLLAVGRRVRRDVRRPRRRAHPAPVRDRARQPPGDHLHRRDRRRRRRARLGQQLRARADAQPAAGRDGRLQLDRRPRRDRRLQPAREARPGAAAPRPLRPPDLRLPARRGRPRGDHARPHARQAAAATSTSSCSRARPPGLTGADLANLCNEAAIFAVRARRAGDRRRRTSTPRSSASWPACSRAARSTSTSAASSPSTRPATRCAPSCCPASTACTRSRSSRAAGRSATRSTCPEEDRYLKTREELIDYMSVLLGGRAAEEIVFGAITTGASDDLTRVAEISRSMVHEYAMGTSITSLQGVRRGRRRLRPHAPAARRGAAAPRRRGDARRRAADHRAPRQARPARRARCCATRCSSARDIDRIMDGVPALPPLARPGPAGRRRHARPIRLTGRPDTRPASISSRPRARRCPVSDGSAAPPRAPRAIAPTTSASCSQPGAIRAVFQPIVRLSDLEPVGYEGLARFPTPPGLVALPPDVTLAAAGRIGVRHDLEVACWAAISEAGAPPAGRLLFVNVAPDALGHPGLLALADSCRRGS